MSVSEEPLIVSIPPYSGVIDTACVRRPGSVRVVAVVSIEALSPKSKLVPDVTVISSSSKPPMINASPPPDVSVSKPPRFVSIEV